MEMGCFRGAQGLEAGFGGDDLGGLLKHLALILWFYSPEPEGELFFE